METKVLEVVTPQQLILGCLILAACVILLLAAVYKIKGKDALIGLIIKAELIFDWKGSGKEKLTYVLEQAQKLVKPPFSWFVNIQTIERLVKALQPEFDKLKKDKEAANANRS